MRNILPDPLLTLSEFSSTIDDNALFQPISCSVYPSNIMLLLGANGVGKTSLLKSIVKLNDYQGFIKTSAAAVLYLSHEQCLNLAFTVADNLKFLALLENMVLTKDQIYDLAVTLGLGRYLLLPTYNLSKGQKQRLHLSRLWYTSKTIWLLDEPLVNLDNDFVHTLKQLLLQHLAKGGAVLLTSHQAIQLSCPIINLELKSFS